jgi:uncharacterized protein (TIGR01244 family)
MNPFRQLNDTYWVAPQINLEALAEAAALGVKTVISNRPDGEEMGQLKAGQIADAAREKGMQFLHLPMTGPPSPEQTEALIAQLAAEPGITLGFCRSGTRSTIIWAFAMTRSGRLTPDEAITAAGNAGYDISQLRPMLAAQTPG